MLRIELDEAGKKKLNKLKNVKISRKVVTSSCSTGGRIKTVDLHIKTLTNSALGNVEDWLCFEGDGFLGLPKYYFYAYYTEEILDDMVLFLDNLKRDNVWKKQNRL